MDLIDKHHRSHRAIELLEYGFRNSIVSLQVNLPKSNVRALDKTIQEGSRLPSGRLAAPAHFINSMKELAEASLFIACYRSVGGEAVFKTVDMDTLMTAHRLYLEIRSKIKVFDRSPFCPNKAWSIARDIRASLAWIRVCPRDNAYYLVVKNQKQPSGCPYCQLSDSPVYAASLKHVNKE